MSTTNSLNYGLALCSTKKDPVKIKKVWNSNVSPDAQSRCLDSSARHVVSSAMLGTAVAELRIAKRIHHTIAPHAELENCTNQAFVFGPQFHHFKSNRAGWSPNVTNYLQDFCSIGLRMSFYFEMIPRKQVVFRENLMNSWHHCVAQLVVNPLLYTRVYPCLRCCQDSVKTGLSVLRRTDFCHSCDFLALKVNANMCITMQKGLHYRYLWIYLQLSCITMHSPNHYTIKYTRDLATECTRGMHEGQETHPKRLRGSCLLCRAYRSARLSQWSWLPWIDMDGTSYKTYIGHKIYIYIHMC